MSIFTIDISENWARVEAAIQKRSARLNSESDPYRTKDENGHTLARRIYDEMEEEIRDALSPIRIDQEEFLRQIGKLLMSNNHSRAIKIIELVKDDTQLRWGWQLLLNLTIFPFRIIFKILKMILP